MKFSLIIFDVDGVLIDSENVIPQVECRYITNIGFPVSVDELKVLLKGKRVKDLAAIVSSKLGHDLPDEWLYDLAMATAYDYVAKLKAIRGVEDVLVGLKKANIPICAASQSPYWRIKLGLSVAKLEQYLGDRLFSSSMVKHGKPAPDIFLHYWIARRRSQLKNKPNGPSAAGICRNGLGICLHPRQPICHLLCAKDLSH
jgi:beta-phosphoglucomutase-like phosphatase (HAD superfamily)